MQAACVPDVTSAQRTEVWLQDGALPADVCRGDKLHSHEHSRLKSRTAPCLDEDTKPLVGNVSQGAIHWHQHECFAYTHL